VITSTTLVLAAVVLGLGTFAFRFAGPLLRSRVEISPRVERLMAVAAIVLLAALVATATLLDGPDFAGFARPAGVAVGSPGAVPGSSWWCSPPPRRRPACACSECPEHAPAGPPERAVSGRRSPTWRC
jgi:uncharacterized membrane protein